MTENLVVLIVAIFSLILPTKYLFLLGVIGVVLADTKLVSSDFIYYLRFLPMIVLFLRIVADFKYKGESTDRFYFLIKVWGPFLALALISVCFALEPFLSLQRYISALFVLTGAGVGIPMYFRSSEKTKSFLKVLALALGIGILYSLYLSSSDEPASMAAGEYERLHGIFRNPNTLGVLSMQLIFLLVYLLRSETNIVLRKIIFGAAVGVGVAMISSGSRAAVLGFSIGLQVLLWAVPRGKRKTVSLLCTIVLLLFSVFLVSSYFFPLYSGGFLRKDTAGRTALWERALNLYEEESFFGTGFGNGQELFAKDSLYLKSIGIYAPDPHNSFLTVLLELGYIGVAFTVFAFVLVIRRGWKLLPYFDDVELGRALLAVLFGCLVDAFFESWLFSFGSSVTVPFWFFLGLFSYQTERAKARMKWAVRFIRFQRLSHLNKPIGPTSQKPVTLSGTRIINRSTHSVA